MVRTGIAAVLAVMVLVLSAACSSTDSTPDGLVEGERGLTRIPVAERHEAPIAMGDDLDGSPLSTEDFPGKVIVLNVWGSWCNPCRKEAPDLIEAQDRTAEVAQFIGINTRDLDPAPARAFARSFGLNYRSIFDPSGAELLKYGDLPPGAIPSTLIIDAEGRVAARIIGIATVSTLVGLIEDVAAGK